MRIKGFAIIYTLVIMTLILLIISTFFIIAYNQSAAASTAANSIKAYYIAEAGITKKFMELRGGNTSSLSESFTISSGETGSYSVSVTLIMGGLFQTYRLDSTGTYKGLTKRISLTLRQIACSKYAYLSNDEDKLYWYGEVPIWFVTGDLIRGPLHSNDQLNISGSPVFEGAVSSSATSINYYHGGPPTDNPDFKESLTLGAPTVQLPTSTEILDNIKTSAQSSDGLYLTGNTIITLRSDGTMDVTNTAKQWYTPHNTPVPANGAVYVYNGYVDVSGVVNGQITIGTSNSIYVTNNVLYHDDPRINLHSADMLGLVAQNSVYVDKNAPSNVEIDAYIVALNTSFGVENYDVGLKGTLTLLGGITQLRRGAIGTFNSTTGEKVSGYTKNYIYDQRLQSAVPLYFPPAKDANGRIVYSKISYSES